jgi:hypothetical protein
LLQLRIFVCLPLPGVLSANWLTVLWSTVSSTYTFCIRLGMFPTVSFSDTRNSASCFWRASLAVANVNECYIYATCGEGWTKSE